MITVLHDRVLIKKIEATTTTTGGIVLAPSATEQKHEGIVIALGEGRRTKDGVLIPLTVKVDDHVIYNPQSGTGVKINGESLLVIKEEEIYAVLDQG